MVENRFHGRLRAKITEYALKQADFLAGGGPHDWAGYREIVGELRGLQNALKLCEDIEQEND